MRAIAKNKAIGMTVWVKPESSYGKDITRACKIVNIDYSLNYPVLLTYKDKRGEPLYIENKYFDWCEVQTTRPRKGVKS